MSCLRYHLRLLPLLALPLTGHAQQLLDFQYSDSLSGALLAGHRYRALDSVGRAARALGAGYPALSCRLGAAALAAGHPSAALGYYGEAYRQNPLDAPARAGLALAYAALGQPGPAALLAHALPDSMRRALHLPGPGAVTGLEAEGSVLATADRRRGPAFFGRAGVGSRFASGRVALRQDVSYYHQQVEVPRPGSPGEVMPHTIGQWQYHALLAVQLAPRWQAKGGYDYISRDLGSNHLGYLALAYAHPYFTAQAGLYAGLLADTARTQADLRLTAYPLGSLRLYAFGRGSVVASGGQGYGNGLLGAGGQLRPWLWAEAWLSGGRVPVLAELDGTYVYNLLDPLRRRAAVSLLILPARRLVLRLTYGQEQRLITLGHFDYTLHSFTASLARTW